MASEMTAAIHNHPMRATYLATAAVEAAVSLEKLIRDEPSAAEALFSLRAERRQKPCEPNADGTEWRTRSTIIIKDADGRIVAELPETGDAA